MGVMPKRKPISALMFIFFACIVLQSCSWVAEVLVVNNTTSTAKVTFSFRDNNAGATYRPKIYKVERWTADSTPVVFDTTSVILRQQNNSTWYVELPPGNALVIAEGLNLDLRDDEQLKTLLNQSSSLQVVMPNDSIMTCDGDACLPEVQKFARGRAGIILK